MSALNQRIALPIIAMLMLIFVPVNAAEIIEIRTWKAPDRTRFVFDLTEPVKYSVLTLKNPDRFVIDIKNSTFKGALPSSAQAGPSVQQVRLGTHKEFLRFVWDLNEKVKPKYFTLEPNSVYGHRLVLDLHRNIKTVEQVQQQLRDEDNRFVVMIDAGHGGEDPGAVGSKKTYEKHVVLQIAKKLRDRLNKVQGIHAELTRNGDYFIPLKRRTAIARKHRAEIFVSIHADAFHKRSAHGISVFTLSRRGATSETARWLANKENASDLIGGVSLKDKDDELAEVLIDLQSSKTMERSMNLGGKVLNELGKVGRLHGRRVESAGFAVLKSPDIPSILIETGFISNPGEEKKLKSSKYQARIADAIARGIIRYARQHSRTKVAWQDS